MLDLNFDTQERRTRLRVKNYRLAIVLKPLPVGQKLKPLVCLPLSDRFVDTICILTRHVTFRVYG